MHPTISQSPTSVTYAPFAALFPAPCLLEAAGPLLPERLSSARLAGMTGSVIRTSGGVPTWSDLTALLLPGLEALGVRAEQIMLPEETADLFRVLHERLRRSVSVPVFAFSKPTELLLAASDEDTSEAAGEDAEEDAEPTITAQGRVLALDTAAGTVSWQDTEGQKHYETVQRFQKKFTHAYRLLRATAKGRSSANARDALLRWVAFADAYPARCITDRPQDVAARTAAAAFLTELAGQTRRPIPTRLRYAAAAFSEGEVTDAFAYVRAAVLRALQLPAAVQHALLSPPETALNEIERRELIYIARAGTLGMKVLAARRLETERHHADVRRTLQQLRFAPDAWVRAAARPTPS